MTFDVLKRLEDAKSLSELDHLFKLYMGFEGFTGYTFTYFGRTRHKDQKLNHELVSERMKAWHDYYHEAHHDNTDSTHQEVYKSLLPVHWDVAQQLAEARTEKERVMRQESLDLGVTHGLSIPLHGPGGDFAELTLRQFKGETCLQNWQIKQAEWYLAGLVYFNFVRELMMLSAVSDSKLLTNRETQCIKLLASNYTVAQIAKALAMTERTVNFHIQNVNHKLKVRNKYEAVLKARDLGLIA